MTLDNGVHLRPATPSDSASIRSLIFRVGINPRGLDWRRFLVAVDAGGRLIGCGQVKPHADGSRELASIAVRPSGRRRGLASQIIRRLMTEAGHPLWLMCRSDLAGFYRRFGFVSIEDPQRMPRYFRRVYRLAAAAARILPGDNPMAVMMWEEGTPPTHGRVTDQR
jgi:N-acetylglutamate synthase-like GNAT family acetyltransferase